MKTSTLLKALLIAVMGFGLCACSSDDDEPKTPESKYVSAADFDAKVKGRMWKLDRISTVMSDGTEYDKLIWPYLSGSSGIEIEGFQITDDQMSFFWTPSTYRPGINYHSLEKTAFTYDEETGLLTLKTALATQRDFTVLSVSDNELILGDMYGITPKDFNPEKYDEYIHSDGDCGFKIDLYDTDPDSYLKFTLRPATDEETAEFWNEYKENE